MMRSKKTTAQRQDAFEKLDREMEMDLFHLFQKHSKEDFMTAMALFITNPVNVLLKILSVHEEQGNISFKELCKNINLPATVTTVFKPFETLAHKWGAVSAKEFKDLYSAEVTKELQRQRAH